MTAKSDAAANRAATSMAARGKQPMRPIWNWLSTPTTFGNESAWSVGDAAGAHVYVKRGGTVRQLLLAQEPVYVAGWWPDGRGLLAWHYWGYCNSCNFDGVRLSVLTMAGRLVDLANVDLQAGGYAWSPDGHHLLVSTGGNRFVVEGDPRVLICDTRDATCQPVARPPGDLDVTAAWSPSGHWIVFSRGQKPVLGPDVNDTLRAWQESLAIWVARADGSSEQMLATPGGSFPSWSPDGTAIYFVRMGHRWRHDLSTDANVDTGQIVTGAGGPGWIHYASPSGASPAS